MAGSLTGTRDIKAAIVRRKGGPFSIETLTLDEPRAAGAAPMGTEASFDMGAVMSPGKTLRGIIQGDSVPDLFIPRLVEFQAQSRFPLEKLIRFYPFEEINQAAADSENGVTIKPVLRMN